MEGRSLCAAAIVLSISLLVPTALGNGRFPRAQRVVESPGHPERLTVAGTYGLLVTDDRGKNWSHVCDAAFTFEPMFASDVLLEITADGSLVLGVQKSVTISHDRGCDFAKVFEPPGASSIDDFTMSSTNLDEVLALVTTFEGGRNTVRLQESMDGGQTWKVTGSPLPAALVYTLDVDPQNSSRLYVTGSALSSDAQAPELFLTSSDRGGSWAVGTIPGTSIDSSPWIAAIHPRDGNKIFVRTDSWKKDVSSQDIAGDALLYSDDGGKTWTELLRAGGSEASVPGAKMLGFALSPDGSTALVGYGDIVDPVRVVDPDAKWVGLYQSSSDGRYSFGPGAPAAPVRLMNVPVTCLSWTKEGIYGCFAPKGQGQYVAFTADPSLTPASFTTLMKTSEVLGAPRCCKGRAVSTCAWDNDCKVLGACDAGTPAVDAGGAMCEGAGGSGGTGADAGATGGTGGGAAGAAGGVAGATDGSGSRSPDGCGCRLVGARTNEIDRRLFCFAGVLIAATRRCRTRRR